MSVMPAGGGAIWIERNHGAKLVGGDSVHSA
jgi:hypothetical protein